MNRREWMGKVGGATAGALMSQLIGTGPLSFNQHFRNSGGRTAAPDSLVRSSRAFN